MFYYLFFCNPPTCEGPVHSHTCVVSKTCYVCSFILHHAPGPHKLHTSIRLHNGISIVLPFFNHGIGLLCCLRRIIILTFFQKWNLMFFTPIWFYHQYIYIYDVVFDYGTYICKYTESWQKDMPMWNSLSNITHTYIYIYMKISCNIELTVFFHLEQHIITL